MLEKYIVCDVYGRYIHMSDLFCIVLLYVILVLSYKSRGSVPYYFYCHHNDAIMGTMASQITSLMIVYSTVYSGADQGKHQNSALLAILWGIHQWPDYSRHKGPVTRKNRFHLMMTSRLFGRTNVATHRLARRPLIRIMMTSSNGNIFRVTGPLCGEFTGPGEFPAQRPVTRSFDVFVDLRLNKRLSKQPRGWWFKTPS